MKDTWEKIFEYASMPVHGTLSRKLRKGVTLQINEGKIFAEAVVFLGDQFVRITEEDGSSRTVRFERSITWRPSLLASRTR